MKKLSIWVLSAALRSCGSPSNESSNTMADENELVEMIDSRLPDWAANATIYEVNIRQYTKEGTINAFSEHLPRLKELGVDILWIMPVQPIGEKNRKGPLGSYYSIQDYTSVNPNFGTMDDFKALVDQAHELGLKVILDWVANHTAFDHTWTVEHPEFYTYDEEGNINVAKDNEGNVTDWTDVADLNYENQDLWAAMADEMRFWVDSADIDEFRCDVAGFVPMDFWNYLSEQRATRNKELFMMAEWAEPTDMQNFHMNYGWDVHHVMNEVAKGIKSPSDIEMLRLEIDSNYTQDDLRMYFTTNHDENSWNGTVFERMGKAHFQWFVFTATFDRGMPLIYSGQEVGLSKRLKFFDKDWIDWSVETDSLTGWNYNKFYTAMMDIYHNTPALWNGNYGGDFSPLVVNDEKRTYAYARRRDLSKIEAAGPYMAIEMTDNSEVVAAFNFGNAAARFTKEELELKGSYKVFDGQTTNDWNADEANDLVILEDQFLIFFR